MQKLHFKHFQFDTKVGSFNLFDNHPNLLFQFYTWNDLGKVFSNELQTSHRHDFYMIAWLRKGKYKQVIEDETYEIQDDTIILGHPDQKTMCIETSGIQDAVILCINAKVMTNISKSLSNFFIHNVFYDTNFIPLKSSTIKKEVTLLFKNLEKECSKHVCTEVDYLVQINIFVHIVLLLLRQNQKASNIMQERGNQTKNLYIQFAKLVNEKFSSEHNVCYYAKELAVSRKTLERSVKTNSGKTPKQIIIERLIQAANILVHEKKYTPQAVASVLGFKDDKSFYNFISSQRPKK